LEPVLSLEEVARRSNPEIRAQSIDYCVIHRLLRYCPMAARSAADPSDAQRNPPIAQCYRSTAHRAYWSPALKIYI